MNRLKPYDYIISPGYIYIPDMPMVLGAVVGDGVVVTLYDTKNKKGGMCHYTKPQDKEKGKGTPIFGEIAVSMLVNLFIKKGSKPSNLKAHVIGGAEIELTEESGDSQDDPASSSDKKELARKNLRMARRILGKYRISGVAYSAGGYQGKKILYHTGSDELLSANVNNIRFSDWLHDLKGQV